MQQFFLENLIMILIVLFLIFDFMKGYESGFLKRLLSLANLIIAIIITRTMTPIAVEVVKDFTNIQSTISNALYKVLMRTDIFDKVDVSVIGNIFNAQDMTNAMSEYINSNLTNLILNIICGAGVFFTSLIFLKIICKLLDVVDVIPVVGELNKILGGILGVIEGVFVIWFIFMIFRIFSGVPVVGRIVENIKGSPLVMFLYENNMIYNILESLLDIFK